MPLFVLKSHGHTDRRPKQRQQHRKKVSLSSIFLCVKLDIFESTIYSLMWLTGVPQ